MTKYVIVFRQPIRIGLDISEVAGPFTSIYAAHQWYAKLKQDNDKSGGVFIPDGDVRVMLTDDTMR